MTGLDRRPYITVSLDFFEHPKTLSITEPARFHILTIWAYCSRYLTDGKVPTPIVKAKGPKIARELHDAGFLEQDDNGDWWCHDYLQHQPSREAVEERISAKAEKQKRGGQLGAHTTHHVRKGRFDPECVFCVNPADDPGPDPHHP